MIDPQEGPPQPSGRGVGLICGAVSVVAAALIVRLPGGPIRRPHVAQPDVGPEVPGADR